ncbi:MAG TPA: citrate/2-methylcitrate synthase, partial [Rhizomicrobium sp.]|nr:citrate/2-methylcitrate synthase [Rhizomicrobium sp.]
MARGVRVIESEAGATARKPMATTGAGLEGIIATTSKICYIDGERGILSYFGYNIHVLAEDATFEEVIYLLWNGVLPTRSELAQLKAELAAERELPEGVIALLRHVPKGTAPMDVLRTAISMLSFYDPLVRDNSPEANQKKAVKLMARVATIVTTFNSLRNGKPIVAGDPNLGFAANFLYTLNGRKPDEVMERAFDIALILHADHELNASTFAARVTAATLSDMYSAVTSAVGALKGPLHGGANESVIQFLLDTSSAEEAGQRVRDDLNNKVRVSGFGHRVYRVLDPRAIHLKKISE